MTIYYALLFGLMAITFRPAIGLFAFSPTDGCLSPKKPLK